MLENTYNFMFMHGLNCGEFLYVNEAFVKLENKIQRVNNFDEKPTKFKNTLNWKRYKLSSIFSINSKVVPKI